MDKIAVAITLYGCGPNIPIGITGAVVTGALATKYKVKETWFKSKLYSCDPTEINFFRQKIYNAYHQKKANLFAAKAFALSTIPIVGPWGVFYLM